jgi:2'-5' RNA ligase
LIPADARAIHPADLHLTLRFLGELSDDRLLTAERAIDRVATTAPTPRITIDHLDHFARARVLWCGPRFAPAPLIALVKALEGALAAEGFTPEERPYRPHLTLARKLTTAIREDWSPAIRMETRDLRLAAGRAGGRTVACAGDGPRYAARTRWTLAPADGHQGANEHTRNHR